jgi:opacity protein-like surface antigen
MKKPFRTLAVCSLGIAALACASPALAQSYWRFDGGLSKSRKVDLKDDSNVLICGNAACTQGAVFDDVKTSPLFDFGWGYRFGRFFHSDITLAFRNGYHLDASDKTIIPSSVKADIKSTALMLNMYLDFPTSSGANPYIGIGVGASQNKISDIVVRSGVFTDTRVTAPGGKKTNAAGAIMAGISMPMSSGTVVEFGFRFVDLGKIESDAGITEATSFGITTPGTAYGGMKGRLRATEWTIGIRF